jgi:hypothetical protein
MRLVAASLLLAACTTTPAESGLVPSDATRVTLHRTGGFAANPAGSTCTAMDETYALDLVTGAFSYAICAPSISGGPNGLITGEAVALPDQVASLRGELTALPAVIPTCSGDFSDVLSITTRTSTITHEQVQCLGGESDVYAALREIAFAR